MIKTILKRLFDLREGEINIALLMQSYIFLIIATLLIVKPTVNSLFISDVGVENLPFAYLLVALTAVITSYFYSKASDRYSLQITIKSTLFFFIASLTILGVLLHLGYTRVWVLYLFYIGVAIYAVLATSQFWVLANLVFNVREAKRVFGFIGAGAISGGIFGGYLTTILAPIIGNENLIFLAAIFLLICLPLLSYIWKTKIEVLNTFKQKKRIATVKENPFRLILGSNHLKYLAVIIGIGVIIAKLVEYQFSYIASIHITDSDELTAFFGFWLSSFHLVSLLLQLFVTNKIVGVWGVGYSLLILPVLIFSGGILFLIFPELWVIIILRGSDASLKQSSYKSAIELIALPLPFELKKKTKSFIDVVVDSIATGIAGCLLIFFIKGLDVAPQYIMLLIMALSMVWLFFISKIRKEYFLSFRKNLEAASKVTKRKKLISSKESFLKGMLRVFEEGNESEILYMLDKALEIQDNRLEDAITKLLTHPSNRIKVAALHNLYFLNNQVVHLEVKDLLHTNDKEVVGAALNYLLLHADTEENIVFDKYLDHHNEFISNAALLSLAKEARDNPTLRERYKLSDRIEHKINKNEADDDEHNIELIHIIGFSDFEAGYDHISNGFGSTNPKVQKAAIAAAGLTLNSRFIDTLLEKQADKNFREVSTKALLFYGNALMPVLFGKINSQDINITIKTVIPKVIEAFNSQEAANILLDCFVHAEDLSVRLESVASLTSMREVNTNLHFNQTLIAKLILEECKLYNSTIDAMHTQIIVHYLRRKKFKVADEQMMARESLLELLERRLENGLKRIFKLLELRYPQDDVRMAYNGITSGVQENVTNAIEFLDLLLNPNLKMALIPIVEATVLDTTSEEVIDAISKNRTTEFDCFKVILEGKDKRLKLAVLFLISKTTDKRYVEILMPLVNNKDHRIKEFTTNAINALSLS